MYIKKELFSFKNWITALILGAFVAILSIFKKSCGADIGGINCKFVSDMMLQHGFPLPYYFIGGIAGTREFHITAFILDILIWTIPVFILILITKIIRK